MAKLSPMMQQYLLLKESYKDCILMFRLGDFYEMFFEDAQTASKELELVLTGRDCGLEERAPMCGVPYHSVNNYIKKLVENGHKVAICEQMTDPATSKGLVEREIVRVITPGTVIEENMLERESCRYILSVFWKKPILGCAWCDVSTGEFVVDQIKADGIAQALEQVVGQLDPAEIITDDATYLAALPTLSQIKAMVTTQGAWNFSKQNAEESLLKQFHQPSIKELELEKLPVGVQAAGALSTYLIQTQKVSLLHINRLQKADDANIMMLDKSTKRNLELTQPMMGSGKKGTLFGVLDKTRTAQGSRLLKRWIEQPLQNAQAIEHRQNAVACFFEHFGLREQIRDCLDKVYDLERLCSKISYQTLNARDAKAICQSMSAVPEIKSILAKAGCPEIDAILNRLDPLEDLVSLIDNALIDDPPISVRDGGIIKPGYNQEVDTLRSAATDGKQWLAELEAREKEETGIKTLKIGYNKVFGYYIEVSKGQIAQVPYRYVRKQTLVNAERYITEELKKMEETLLGAQEKCIRLEYALFVALREEITTHIRTLQTTSKALAELDVLQALAFAAYENKYVRPKINQEGSIHITEGRHPVVEKTVSGFVPNNVKMDQETDRLLIITGPNMSGKSTYMRQVAVIVLMAHIGSFVPADSADICLVDQIFTRVGASDDLASGRSTFMVEMTETANILNHATKNSLVLLDEIGRGTSTFDGLSIAWAVSEYLCSPQNVGAKTLFATHYHELAGLEGTMPGVKNYCVLAREIGDDIVFLHRISPGATDKSFGIEVAKLAGVPKQVVKRAREVLNNLQDVSLNPHLHTEETDDVEGQMKFDAGKDNTKEIIKQLCSMDMTQVTPMEAFAMLHELTLKANGVK